MKCPECQNGIVYGVFPLYSSETPMEKRKPVVTLPCPLCEGTSVVDDGFPERKMQGEVLRLIRAEHCIALREFSKRYGISSATISDFERGKKLADDIAERLLMAYQQLKDSPIDESLA